MMSAATRSARVGALPSSLMPSSAPFASPASCRLQAQQAQQHSSNPNSSNKRCHGGMEDVDSNASITRGVDMGAGAAAPCCAPADSSASAAAASAASSSVSAFPALPAVTHSPSGAGCMSALRLAKDLSELSASKFTAQASTRITFPDGRHNLRRFFVLVTPHSGLYANASFRFLISIPAQYPFQPPKVQCLTPVLHPNIDWRKGRVYLHLLQEEWKPVLSVNAVLFALQLLFLEPWPQATSTSSSSVGLLPSVASSSSTSSGYSHDREKPSALALASSKSATSCSTHQLSQDAVLCPEIRALILQAGGKQEFESVVRRTLEGGFAFGRQWARNQTEPESDSSSEEADDGDDTPAAYTRSKPGGGGAQLHYAGLEDREPATPFETMLARVEQNGRQACVSDVQVTGSSNGHHSSDRRASPYPPASVHPRLRVIKHRDHITPIAELDADDDTLADCVAPSASASAQPPARGAGHRRTAKIRGNLGDALAVVAGGLSSSPSASPSKRTLGLPSLPHGKRSHHLMAKSSPHAPNPAAALAESRPSFQRVADGSGALHSHKRIRSAPAAAVLARSCTSNHRIVKLRSFDTPFHATASSGAASASAASAVANVAGRSSRKRPSPAPAVSTSQSASLSDGEYELLAESGEDQDAEGDVQLNSRASPTSTAAQDDHSPSVSAAHTRRILRRNKKQHLPGSLHAHAAASAGTDELEIAALMQGPAHSSTAFLRLNEQRPPSTVLPDLASFASFRPAGNPLLVASASSSSSSSSSTSAARLSPQDPVAAASSSPKRNASDCGGIAIVAAAPLDLRGARYGTRATDEAASSFILSGRSSSRSINFASYVGTTKAIVAGPGLSNLQDLHASLPATMADVDG